MADDGGTQVESPAAGSVVHVAVEPGDDVARGATLLSLEMMKMQRPVESPAAGRVTEVLVAVGDEVREGQPLFRLDETRAVEAPRPGQTDTAVAPGVRDDLREVHERHALLADEARPDAIRKRHDHGQLSARENLDLLLDDGSLVEYGGLAIAAQRQRRDIDELRRQTPADGLVTGIGTINADLFGSQRARCAVLAYDYTVLAGTQGTTSHHKLDRILGLAGEHDLPLVMYVEGGGGRPGDTDSLGASWLDVTSFRLLARLSGRVPIVAIVNGYCFAGNAALAGCADVILVTQDANLGMAGPAMIEGGGLGRVEPGDIGPTELHQRTGVADVVVAGEREAAAVARRYLAYFQGSVDDAATGADQEPLRARVPEDRHLAYDVRDVIGVLFDTDSVLELRRDAAPGMITALARLGGKPVGVLANVPHHLGGAIDAAGADSAVRFLSLCDTHGLPVVVLCDTPGFMVGPEAEEEAGVRRFGRLFLAGANLSVPLAAVVLRKAYGLGAQAMMGGHLKAPTVTLAWPTGELGPMGLEGAVRLGFRRELEAIDDPDQRASREQELIELAHANASALNVASFAEIDDVIDPAETRDRLLAVLEAAPPGGNRRRRPFVDVW